MAVPSLPPLPAIRCFEAAARLQNFTRAAEELGMTQAAVSYQIKILEDRVGEPLFLRGAARRHAERNRTPPGAGRLGGLRAASRGLRRPA